jgi:hypothetical protein
LDHAKRTLSSGRERGKETETSSSIRYRDTIAEWELRSAMALDGLGSWQPLDLSETVQLFEEYPERWWISGGYALELHVGRSWRSHTDIDVGVLRGEATGITRLLRGWDIEIAASGVLSPWAGAVPLAEESQNNLWCRKGLGHGCTAWQERKRPIDQAPLVVRDPALRKSGLRHRRRKAVSHPRWTSRGFRVRRVGPIPAAHLRHVPAQA